MSVVGALSRAEGRRGVPKVYSDSGTGPASDTTIAAGATGNIDISISLPAGLFDAPPAVIVREWGNLPAGLEVLGVRVESVSVDSVTIRIAVNNPTSGDITVSAGSVTVGILCIG